MVYEAIEIRLDEFGPENDLFVVVAVEFEWIKGEPVTDDYPGSPDEIDLRSATVLKLTDESGANVVSPQSQSIWDVFVLDHMRSMDLDEILMGAVT